jgi:hypothetical protein
VFSGASNDAPRWATISGSAPSAEVSDIVAMAAIQHIVRVKILFILSVDRAREIE